ncbi:MAG TPA: hypothetical protein VN088_16240 [Nocardioides sp.]|nr:hypothetical protein [Nocardioides sp.]
MTALTATKRYINPETTVVMFVPTIADYQSPTSAELSAGTELQGQIADNTGWSVKSNAVDVPDWGSRYTSQINGMITADASALTLYADQTGNDARTLMPRNTTGYVVWMDGGNVVGQKMDVYPVSVSYVSKLRTASDPAKIEFGYTITAEPAEDVAIPS